MSRQIIIPTLLVLMTALVSTGVAQNYTQLGMMSGSGLVFMPSTSNSPSAQFRLQFGRIGLTKRGGRGFNLVNLSAGFSPFLEGYLKFTSEQVGSFQSVGAVGIGAKLTIPYIVPVAGLVSLWGESSTTPNEDRSELYSPVLSRGAIIVTPYSNGIRPSCLLGATKTIDGNIQMMEGASLVVTTGHFTQWGVEYLHGYNGVQTDHLMVSGVIRPLPYISLTAGPGYLKSPTASGWLWSIGVSVNTSDIDFKPVEKKLTDKYKLPTIEDLEKGPTEEKSESNEEKKNE